MKDKPSSLFLLFVVFIPLFPFDDMFFPIYTFIDSLLYCFLLFPPHGQDLFIAYLSSPHNIFTQFSFDDNS